MKYISKKNNLTKNYLVQGSSFILRGPQSGLTPQWGSQVESSPVCLARPNAGHGRSFTSLKVIRALDVREIKCYGRFLIYCLRFGHHCRGQQAGFHPHLTLTKQTNCTLGLAPRSQVQNSAPSTSDRKEMLRFFEFRESLAAIAQLLQGKVRSNKVAPEMITTIIAYTRSFQKQSGQKPTLGKKNARVGSNTATGLAQKGP